MNTDIQIEAIQQRLGERNCRVPANARATVMIVLVLLVPTRIGSADLLSASWPGGTQWPNPGRVLRMVRCRALREFAL